MSKSHKGKTVSVEARAKIKKALKGKKHSAEHRANVSASLKGRIISDEHRAKMSAAQKGRVISNEALAKIITGRVKASKSLQTPDGVFPSALEYSKFVGVARITIYKRIEKYPDQYYFIKECQE
jgi:hypothetical protein